MTEGAPQPHKVLMSINIKSHIPLLLDIDRRNYDAWIELFSTHCIGFDVIDHIDDTYKEPAPEPADPEWMKVDSIVKLWIYRTISQSLLEMVVKKDSSARDVWIRLEYLFGVNKYVNKYADAKELQKELRTVSMGDLSVTEYLSKIKTIVDLLDRRGAPAYERYIVIYTINGLSSKFNNIKSILKARDPLPSFLETSSMLLLEEQQIADQHPAPSPGHSDTLNINQDEHSIINIDAPSTSGTRNLPKRLYEDMQDPADLRTTRLLGEAAFIGDWEAAKVIIDERPELVRFAINANQETLLHLAASAENSKQTQEFVENLVDIMKVEDLELVDFKSNTAFHFAAANGSIERVNAMLKKNEALLRIPNMDRVFPISLSACFGHHDLTRHLYQLSEGKLHTYMGNTPLNSFVKYCIYSEMFDIALDIVTNCPYELTERTYRQMLDSLGRMPNSLNRPKQNMICKIIDPFFVKLHMMSKEPSESDQASNLLEKVLDQCTRFKMDTQLRILKAPSESAVIFAAVEMGNTAFVIELVQVYPRLLTERNANDDNIFHVAIMHRHHGIYNLLYEIGKKRLELNLHLNAQGNTLLHVVAKKSKGIQTTSGASLLMQRELLWFQDVEKMMPTTLRQRKNNDGQTAYELFFEEKKDLISGGLKWMKDCMVTATLIVTIAFAVAFTVPGGYNQNTGFPMFLHETSFLVFVMADAVSLFSSSTSLLVFLSILTSNYGHRDFLYSLPRKLMIGLLTLFISVVAMMVTFAASFFVLYNNGLKWVPIVISILAVVPVMIFAAFQLPVWSDMFRSTFDSRYLFKPQRSMLYNKSKRV